MHLGDLVTYLGHGTLGTIFTTSAATDVLSAGAFSQKCMKGTQRQRSVVEWLLPAVEAWFHCESVCVRDPVVALELIMLPSLTEVVSRCYGETKPSAFKFGHLPLNITC